MRIARTLAGLVLLGGIATGCGGGGSDAPDDAAEKNFCKAIEAAPAAQKPSQDDVDEWVDELKDTGTPDNIGEDERHGFEVMVDTLEDVDVEDFDDISKFEDAVEDDDDREDVKKFFVYYAETCTGAGELPTEFPTENFTSLPTDLPTEFPSGFPTELPSGFPTEMPSGFPTDMEG